jgi:hypothetical protein
MDPFASTPHPDRRITHATKNRASLPPQDRDFDRPMNEAG